MLRISTKFLQRQYFCASKVKPLGFDSDLANVTGLLQQQSVPTLSFYEKISYLSPGNLYNNLDQLSRDVLFSLVTEYGMGLPGAVIMVSLAIKAVFFMPTLKSQAMALKMREIKPLMDKFQQKTKIGQMSRNMAMVKQAKRQFNQAKKKRGVDNFYAFVNILQIPFLVTWFLSLRYIASLPEVYPAVQESFLWMEDISAFDPYFLLPLFSACITSYSIILSPSTNRNAALPIFAPFLKYLKFFPFISLPITAFFPALLNIYWATLASSQLILMISLNSEFMKKRLGLIKQAPISRISKAVFIEDSIKTDKKQSIKSSSHSEPANKINQHVEQIKISSKRMKKKKNKD